MAIAGNARAASCRVVMGCLAAALAGPLAAQAPPDSIRSRIEGARLGTGYAQILNLAATPDLSAASYRSGPTARRSSSTSCACRTRRNGLRFRRTRICTGRSPAATWR